MTDDKTAIADDLRAAFTEDAENAVADPEPDPSDEVVDEPNPVTPDPDPAVADPSTDAAGRKHDPATGKFVTGETDTLVDAATGDDEPPAATGEPATDDSALEAELGPLEPPAHWPLAEQEMFRKQPKPVQEWALARDKAVSQDFEQKTQVIATERQRFEPLAAVLDPRAPQFAIDGVTEAQYVANLAALSDFANKNPVDFMKWFAGQRGIDLAHLAPALPATNGAGDDTWFENEDNSGTSGTSGAPVPMDPAFAEGLKRQNDRLDAMEAAQTERERNAQATQHQTSVHEIQAFRDALGDDGQLLHPHFAEVEGEMVELIQKGVAGDVEKAYTLATRFNDDVAAKIRAEADAKATREAQAERKRKSEAAQRAGSSVTGLPGSSSSPSPAGSVREEIARQFAAARG